MIVLPRRYILRLMGAAAGAAGMTTVAGAIASARAGPPDAGADSAAIEPSTRAEFEQVRGARRPFRANFVGPGFMAPLVDEWVLHAQEWVNAVYGDVPGFQPAPETGRTGWSTIAPRTRMVTRNRSQITGSRPVSPSAATSESDKH